jgi:TPR repeat protein
VSEIAIFQGSNNANTMRELNDKLEPKCPFCREPWAKERSDKNLEWKKRAEANDPMALFSVGKKFYEEGDYDTAFEYFTKAVESGNVEANRFLSFLYRDGNGVEKDKKKQVYHLEEGAIAGNHAARYDLGFVEFGDFKRTDRAVKHWIIAASNGQNEAMKVLKDGYRQGLVTKDDLLQVLRAYQAAIDATKSPQREEANAALQRIKPRLQQM